MSSRVGLNRSAHQIVLEISLILRFGYQTKIERIFKCNWSTDCNKLVQYALYWSDCEGTVLHCRSSLLWISITLFTSYQLRELIEWIHLFSPIQFNNLANQLCVVCIWFSLIVIASFKSVMICTDSFASVLPDLISMSPIEIPRRSRW